MSSEVVIETDVLVIGGGTAGCFAAIKAREQGLDVTIVDKAYAGKSGAGIAASGAWSVFNPEWGFDIDTSMNEINKSGEYLNNRKWSEIILKESWDTYQDLISWGVEFPQADESMDFLKKRFKKQHRQDFPRLAVGLVRLKHRKTTPFLRKQAEKVGVKIIDRIMVTDLLKQNGKVVGAVGFPMESYKLYVFKAKATILCAGRNGFKPPGMQISEITGDADGMAYRAGAELTGKEFPDMHTSLAIAPAWKSNGELYVAYWHYTDAEGKPITCAGMDLSAAAVIHAGRGPVLWDLDSATPEDLQAMEAYKRKRGNPVEVERIGLDPRNGGKYQLTGGASAGGWEEQAGGIWPVDTKCATSLPGLYVAGDCCCTWCWGATVGTPWGLTPAAVTGKRAGMGAAEYALHEDKPVIDRQELTGLIKILFEPAERPGGFSPRWVTQLLQNTMMPYFILHIKHEKRLLAALTVVEFLRDYLVPKQTANDPHELRLAHETKNMVLNAEMILRSSLFRTESRGHHYREDYPEKDDPAWLAWIKIRKERGSMKLWKEPVPKKWRPDPSKPREDKYYPRWFTTE